MILRQQAPDHYGNLVSDIELAVYHWVSTLGAGPFFMIEHVQFEQLSHFGKPCTFDHSTSFGQCGQVMIEIQQIFVSGPASLTGRLVPAALPVLNHVAYVSDDPEEDSTALTAVGHDLFLQAKLGEIEVRFHDT